MVEGTAQRLDEQVAAVIDKAMHDSWANAPLHGTTDWFGPASLREYLIAAVSDLVRGQADALQAATDERDRLQGQSTDRAYQVIEMEGALQRVRDICAEAVRTTGFWTTPVISVASVVAALGVGVPTEDACRHCGKPPEADGDHSCDCPHTDADCPDHPPNQCYEIDVDGEMVRVQGAGHPSPEGRAALAELFAALKDRDYTTEPTTDESVRLRFRQMKAASVECCQAGRETYPDPCPWHAGPVTSESPTTRAVATGKQQWDQCLNCGRAVYRSGLGPWLHEGGEVKCGPVTSEDPTTPP